MIATAFTKSLLATDAELPQRDILLNERLMARRFSGGIRGFRLAGVDECRIERVKYRFGKGIRALYKVRFGDEVVKVAARTFDAVRLAEMRTEKKAQGVGTAKSSPDFFDEELQAAFWIFPNDRKISSLEFLADIPENMAQISGRVWEKNQLVAYAPEKCATAQCLDGSDEILAYAKVFAGDGGRRIFNVYRTIGGKGARLPRALAYYDAQRTLILEAIRGRRVAELDAEDNDGIYKKFGAAIAAFHRIEPVGGLQSFNRLKPDNLSFALQTIEKAVQVHALRAANVFERLSAFPCNPEPDVCLHGDVHAKNAIWNNDEITLIDLDQVSVGEAAMDIGSFLAALHYKECVRQLAAKRRIAISNEFLSGYASVRPLPAERSLRRNTAAALFAERALRAVTRYRIEGLENMGSILTAAENILSGDQL